MPNTPALLDTYAPLVQIIRQAMPKLLAIHAFGSRIAGTARLDSDLDLAVLVEGKADPIQLWELSGTLADLASCDVDLLDLRAASTIMQHQILITGRRLWARQPDADLFECFVLSGKTALDEFWSGLLADIVLQTRAATIERCVRRAREEYFNDPDTFAQDFTRQDAAILNIQRACEAALDMGHHLIRREGLGLPQSARDVFTLLAQAGWIDPDLAASLRRMVGFRNIAVHDYQSLHMPITVLVITEHLDEFTRFTQAILLRDHQTPD